MRSACLPLLLALSLGCERKPETHGRSAPVTTGRASWLLGAELHVPPVAAGKKVPLMIMLHGLGSSGTSLERASDWPAFAKQHDIAWIAPNGSVDGRGNPFWNAGPSCCNFDHLAVDHVAALAELIQQVIRSAPIDRARVYVGGASNGGFMAHRLACERPELVSGILALAGTGPLDRSACKVPPRQLRVVQVHGTADPIVLYAGGHLFKNPALPESLSAEKTVKDWATALACQDAPQTLPAVDLEALSASSRRASS